MLRSHRRSPEETRWLKMLKGAERVSSEAVCGRQSLGSGAWWDQSHVSPDRDVAHDHHQSGGGTDPRQEDQVFWGRKDSRMRGWSEKSRSEEHTSELQSRLHLVCRLLLEKKKNKQSDLNTCL